MFSPHDKYCKLATNYSKNCLRYPGTVWGSTYQHQTGENTYQNRAVRYLAGHPRELQRESLIASKNLETLTGTFCNVRAVSTLLTGHHNLFFKHDRPTRRVWSLVIRPYFSLNEKEQSILTIYPTTEENHPRHLRRN